MTQQLWQGLLLLSICTMGENGTVKSVIYTMLLLFQTMPIDVVVLFLFPSSFIIFFNLNQIYMYYVVAIHRHWTIPAYLQMGMYCNSQGNLLQPLIYNCLQIPCSHSNSLCNIFKKVYLSIQLYIIDMFIICLRGPTFLKLHSI